MTVRRRIVKYAAIGLAAALAGVWVAGELMISRTNPAERYGGVILSPDADAVLQRACFDCHSNETRYPAYSYLPIASLLLASHVREGREAVNFSEWGRMTAEDKADSIEDSLEEIQRGYMPVDNYVWLHPEARLAAAHISLLEKTALRVYGVRPEAESAGKGKKEKGGSGERERRDRGEREKPGNERR